MVQETAPKKMDESDYLPYDNMNLAKGLQLEIQASFFFFFFSFLGEWKESNNNTQNNYS